MAITFDQKKLSTTATRNVLPNAWNPKEQNTTEYQRVRRSLEIHGLRQPIVVRQVGEHYEIIDGEQRYRAAKELGYETLVIYNEGTMPDEQAKALTIAYQQQVPFDDVNLSTLVAELSTDLLPYEPERLDELLEMANFDWQSLEAKELAGDDADIKTLSVKCLATQYEIIQQAMARIRADNPEASDGRCLELICADFLS